MKYFFATTETIESGAGFTLYDSLHLTWLAICFVALIVNCVVYRKISQQGRSCWRKIIAWLLVADEIFKMFVLFYGGNYTLDYLPLHLCSINIFIIAVHAYRPSAILDNFLYTVCIPGALAALLFPTWTSLPISSGMHCHSFTVHILLVMYPVVLFVNRDMSPSVKNLPKSLGLLLLMSIPIYGINLLLNTNFMFLISADPGNPLYLFEQMWGNHLLGFPIIIAGVLLVMYGPLELIRKLRKKAL